MKNGRYGIIRLVAITICLCTPILSAGCGKDAGSYNPSRIERFADEENFAEKAEEVLSEMEEKNNGYEEWLKLAKEAYDDKLLTYEVVDDHVEITGYKGEDWVYVTIPPEIEGKPVTVVRGDLEEEKGGFGWDHMGLLGVDIPESVTEVGNNAFLDCCFMLEVNLPDSILKIGDMAFQNCQCLEAIELPDNCESIGYMAFFRCRALTEVTIPDSVVDIGIGAFNFCDKLTSLYVSSQNESFSDYDGILFNKDGTELIAYPAGKQDKHYEIPDHVDTLAWGSFVGSTALETIDIPDNVTEIGVGAFLGCERLKTVAIPDQIRVIGSMLFYRCNSLESVYFPSGLTRVETEAFGECENLQDVYYEGSENAWHNVTIADGNKALETALVHYNYDIQSLDSSETNAVEYEPETGTEPENFLVMENVETDYIDVDGPVMYVTLFDGEVLSGPVSSVETYYTSDDFEGFSMIGFSHLTQSRDDEKILFETDDIFCPTVEWSFKHSFNSYYGPDVADQSFSILTEDGVRLISMMNVQEISVEENVSMKVPKMEKYERPETTIISGGHNSFEAQGTATVYLKDGTVYTSYPGSFPKVSTANNYRFEEMYPDYSQTRDFWMEEAKTLSFRPLSGSETTGNDSIIEISGTLSNGERVRKFIVSTGKDIRFLTRERGIIDFPYAVIDHIDVDMSVDADFSNIPKANITLDDGTSFELPAHAVEYMHMEGGGIVVPHPEYDYFFLTGGAEFHYGSGYTEEEGKLLFSDIKEIVFKDNSEGNFGDREFPAEVTYKDGTTETLNFRFYNYYGNALEFYCPTRISYDLDRNGMAIKSIQFEGKR